MAILNITLKGASADYPRAVRFDMPEADVKRLAVEVVRSGEVPGLYDARVNTNTFSTFVVDRISTHGGGQRLYLRPKVPFGE
jgi:hypothetical protein